MKEQILHLDPHDDFISARDKMGWVQTQRVLLVWPPRGRVLTRRLDLVLLHRHAHRLGAQLALITRDASVQEHAAELGLPVFATVEATRGMRWRSRLPRLAPARAHARPEPEAIRRAFFSAQRARLPRWVTLIARTLIFLSGLAAGAALALALLPSATITLPLARQPLTATIPLIADVDQPTVDPAHGLIPARRVRVEVQNTQLTPTTGVVEVPNLPAAGKVVFTNLIGTAAALPVGLSLRTTSGLPVRFTTLQPANLEARIGATAEVAVRAVDPGPSGNVNAGQINAIDGPLGAQLAVTNPAATKGGTVAQRAAVAQNDRDQLRQTLTEQLQQSALTALQAQLQPGELLASDSVTITQVLAESFDRAVGEPADAISLTLRLAATGVAFNEADAQTDAAAALRAQVPAEAALTEAPLRFSRDPQLPMLEAGRVRVTLTATGDSVPRLDVERVRRAVLGQPLARAAQRLQAQWPLTAPPQISLAPDWYARWVGYVPWLWLRVSVASQ